MGACGIACAALGADSVCLTDLPEALPLLQENMRISPYRRALSVEALEWGRSPLPSSLVNADVCICVDCIYQPKNYDALLATLQGLRSHHYVVAWVDRGRSEEEFLRMLRNAFVVATVPSVPDAELARVEIVHAWPRVLVESQAMRNGDGSDSDALRTRSRFV